MGKICSKCKIEKDLEQYGKKTRNIDGLSYYCKECISIENKIYREKNREVGNANNKEYYANNKEYFAEKARAKYIRNKDKYILDNKEYYARNKEYFARKAREYKENNKEKLSEYNKKYMKVYARENKDKRSEYYKYRISTDPLYKLKSIIRRSIAYSIRSRNYKKKDITYEILGCTFDEFRIYIESKFEKWMTWDNYGLYNGELNYGWDLDHIIPSSSAITENDILKLNHYTNFQPLCSYVNRRIKRDRLDYE